VYAGLSTEVECREGYGKNTGDIVDPSVPLTRAVCYLFCI